MNLLKQISATLQSSKDVIDEAPEKSFGQSAAEPSGPQVATVADLLRSQNESEHSLDDDDDFFVPTATQIALGATQTSADQEPTDDFFVPTVTQMALGTNEAEADQKAMDTSIVCIDTAEGQTRVITDSQTVNPPNAPYENRIAEFDHTIETIDDPIEVDSSDSETQSPEFSSLDAPNADSTTTQENESTEIGDIPWQKDTSNNAEDTRWVFK